MSIDEHQLQKNVNRQANPIIRIMYHGTIFAISIPLMIVAGIFGLISGEVAVAIGMLLFASLVLHGVWFGGQMIRLGIEEEERKKMLEEARVYDEKAKRDERLSLSDDGELVDYRPEWDADDAQDSAYSG